MASHLLHVLCFGALVTNAAVYPKVKSTTLYGPATDPALVRDSCGSVAWNTDRILWVCRDTQDLGSDGLPDFPVYTSSASYTNLNKDGSIPWKTVGSNEFNYTSELIMYGNNHDKAFYPLTYDECNDNEAGQCGDTSRYALWPDTSPMVTVINADGSIVAYTVIRKSHILPDLSTVVNDPAASLYRVYWDPQTGEKSKTLPQVEMVNETFWGQGEFAYGNYGNVMRNGTCFLYAKSDAGVISLARVSVGKVEDKSQYEYWVDGKWDKQMPNINRTGLNVPATAGGQGTFYYDDAMESYVWIGQPGFSVAPDFFITTAPEPWGPWIQPQHILTAQSGNYSLGAYSMQAHPAMRANPFSKDIYVSYTKNDIIGNRNLYTQPVYRIEWQ